jgi:hypothetical protein
LVLLNMCESAQVWPSFGNSFIDLFLAKGARAVIGTECAVTPEFGARFGDQLTARLMAGESVAEAIASVRAELLTDGDLRGLLYTLFGDGRARLVPPGSGVAYRRS